MIQRLSYYGLVLSLLAVLSGTASWAQASPFFANLPDVPLMPGLAEQTEGAVVFDKAEGRIIEAVATSATLEETQVLSFYSKALPALGWQSQADGGYVRGDEILKIAVEMEGALLRLRATVTPRE